MGPAGGYLAVGNFDRAMEYVEKEYEKHGGALPYISLWAIHNPELKYNHRYLTPEEDEHAPAGGIKRMKDICNLILAKYQIKGSVAA